MKFCYIDESGIGEEPYAVMVGIIVDAKRMHLTKDHWSSLLRDLSGLAGRSITEIHTRDFYAGNGPWRGLEGKQRSQIITKIFKWLRDRKHLIVYSAVDNKKFYSTYKNEVFSNDIANVWIFMALHLTLSIQKNFQNEKINKGNTVLIFDDEDRNYKNFRELVNNPPSWTKKFYDKKNKRTPLNQIIDTPYFADSQYVGLIQVADFVSFFLRRYIEINQNSVPPKFDGEDKLINEWMEIVFSCSMNKSIMYPSRGRGECESFFWDYAPECLLE